MIAQATPSLSGPLSSLVSVIDAGDPQALPRLFDALSETDRALLPEALEPRLRHADPQIRSRAIRVLVRLSPIEAQRRFDAMLFSPAAEIRSAALALANFLPFATIEPAVMRMLATESRSELLTQASWLLLSNPHPDTPLQLFDIIEASGSEKRALLQTTLSGVVQALVEAQLIAQTHGEFVADLKRRIMERRGRSIIERCRTLWQSAEQSDRLLAVRKLGELMRSGLREARVLLESWRTAARGNEFGPMIDAALAETTEGICALPAPGPARVTWLDRIDADAWSSHRAVLLPAFASASIAEQAALLRAAARFGDADLLPSAQTVVENLANRRGPGTEATELWMAAFDLLSERAPEVALAVVPARLEALPAEMVVTIVRGVAHHDKQKALAIVGQLLHAPAPVQRTTGLLAAGQIDFIATQELLLRVLRREQDGEVLRHLADLLAANLGDGLRDRLAALAPTVGPAARKVIANLTGAPPPSATPSAVTPASQPGPDNDAGPEPGPDTSAIAEFFRDFDDCPADDGALRFAALRRMQAQPAPPGAEAELARRIAATADPAVRLHLQVIERATRESVVQRMDATAATLRLRELLAARDRDECAIAILLEYCSREAGPAVWATLQTAGWSTWSTPLLPFVLRLAKMHGGPADIGSVADCARRDDAHMQLAAIEALERLAPEMLRDELLVSLLASPSQGLRSRAIRVLYKFDATTALEHFADALLNGDAASARAALFHAHFLPFEKIGPLLLQFLSRTNDATLLQLAGALFLINPTPESPLHLLEAIEASGGQRREVFRRILAGVVEALAQSGLINQTAAEFVAELGQVVQRRRHAQEFAHLQATLSSSDVAVRGDAIARLTGLAQAGQPAAGDLLQTQLARETNAELQTVLLRVCNTLAISIDAPATKGGDLLTCERADRCRRLTTIDAEGLAAVGRRYEAVYKQADTEERTAWVQAFARCGIDGVGAIAREALADAAPAVVLAGIAALDRHDPDALAAHLPKLLQHANDGVKAAAIAAFARIDKAGALARLEQMMGSPKPGQQAAAIFAAGQLDFPAVRDLLVATLVRTPHAENVAQIAAILQPRSDDALLRQIAIAAEEASTERRAAIETLIGAAAATLATTTNRAATDVVAQVKQAVAAEKTRQESRPSYAVANVNKVREARRAQGAVATTARRTSFQEWLQRPTVMFAATVFVVYLLGQLFAPASEPQAPVPVRPAAAPKPGVPTVPPVGIDGSRTIQGVIQRVEFGAVVVIGDRESEPILVTHPVPTPAPFKVGDPFRARIKPIPGKTTPARASLVRLY